MEYQDRYKNNKVQNKLGRSGPKIRLHLHLPALCCEACFVKFGFKEEAIELLIACYRSPLFKAVSDTVLSLHNKLKELSVLWYYCTTATKVRE